MVKEIIDEEANVNKPLLITINHTGEDRKLQQVSSKDQEFESVNNTSQRSLLLKVLLVITSIGVLTVCLALIIWITPTPPTVHVHSMHLAFNDRHLPIWSATLSIKNPNTKLRVTYGNPSVLLFHRKKLVGTVNVGSFGQKGGEENEVAVNGDETGVIDEEAARQMEEDVASTGNVVGLDMVFLGRVGFYPVSSTLWGKQNMTALCENVRAKLSTNGEKLYRTKRWGLSFDGRRDCRVRLPMFS